MTDIQPRARPPRQEQEPASEEVTEVAPGVLRMQLPIWMPGLGHVNMYGLVDDRGLAVVDPGLPGPQSWKALKQRLKTAGYGVKDIHTVVVTHSHPDHFGGAGRLYGAAAIALAIPLISFAARVYLIRDGAQANKTAMRMFAFTILYLFVLFGLIVVERAFGLTANWGL